MGESTQGRRLAFGQPALSWHLSSGLGRLPADCANSISCGAGPHSAWGIACNSVKTGGTSSRCLAARRRRGRSRRARSRPGGSMDKLGAKQCAKRRAVPQQPLPTADSVYGDFMASLSQLWLGQSIMLIRRSRARFHRLGDGRRGTADLPMIQSTNANSSSICRRLCRPACWPSLTRQSNNIAICCTAYVGEWHFCDITMRGSTSAFGQCGH
jgi:hypothetical protein